MDKYISTILAQLNLISVRGEDVERLAVAKHMLRQLQAACAKAQKPPQSNRKDSEQHG